MAEATVPEGELFEVLSIPLRREAMEALREQLETLRALRVLLFESPAGLRATFFFEADTLCFVGDP